MGKCKEFWRYCQRPHLVDCSTPHQLDGWIVVSRAREYEADHTGAEVSHDPLALASALRKLQRGSEAVPSPIAQPAFSHLYIVNPLSGQTLAGLFSTHPPLEKRIARLEEMARQGH